MYWKKELIQDLASLGGIPIYLIAFLVFLLLKNFKVAFQIAVVFFLAYFLVVLIRFFYFKERPLKFKYKNLIEKLDAASFPSLHAMRASALALILSFYFGNFILGLIFFIGAALSGLAKVILKKHWLLDIFVGFLLGVFVGFVSIILSNLVF